MSLSNVRKGTRIRVYDSPCGSQTDDWTEIYVKRNISVTQNIIISSFERNVNSYYYTQTYHKNNGLDGKISLIRVTD